MERVEKEQEDDDDDDSDDDSPWGKSNTLPVDTLLDRDL